MNDLPAGPSRRPERARFLALVTVVLLVGGCARQVARPAPGVLAIAPQLSVERFLQASNARDYEAMSGLFGTPDGPIMRTGSTVGCGFRKVGSWLGLGQRCLRWDEVELRMAALSELLRHQDYRIVSERVQPGRRHPTNRVGVDISRGGDIIRDVPFMVVRSRDGRWLVQEVDVLRMAGP